MTLSSSLSGKVDEVADSASAASSNCTTLFMLQENGSLTDKIAEKKRERVQKRKEVLQDTADLKLLQAKKRRLLQRASGMSRDQMMCMWGLWEEADRKKQSKKEPA